MTGEQHAVYKRMAVYTLVGVLFALVALFPDKATTRELDAELYERSKIPDTLPRAFWRDARG